MTMLTLILRLLTLDPIPASHVAAWVVGAPERGPAMARVAWRESRGRWIGEHPRDRWMAERVHRRALERGRLQSWCPWHRSADGMSTRGAWGTIAAYTLDYLAPCVPAFALDVPILGALAAVRRATSRQCGLVEACRRWRGW